MSWVTIIWSMVMTVCLTLAGIHLLIWSKERSRWSSMAFAIAALAVAGTAVAEFFLMYARTPMDSLAAIRWANVALFFMAGGLVGFVRCYFGLGNLWIGGAAVAVRLVGVILNFTVDQGQVLDKNLTLPSIDFLGEPVTIITGEFINPWWVLNGLSTLLFLGFVIEASIRLWLSGNRRKRRHAILVGGSIASFFVVATVISALINRGIIQAPYFISLPFLLIVFVVAYELTRDVVRASSLAADLIENEEHLALAAQAAGFGTYSYNFVTGNMSYSSELLTLYDLPSGAELELDADLVPIAVRPGDKPGFMAAIRHATDPKGARQLNAEFRIRRVDGIERWLKVHGSTTFSGLQGNGTPLRVNGVVQDITAEKFTTGELEKLRTQLAHADRVSSLGQLSSALAHELSQPLGAILRNSEAADLILEQISPDLVELRAIAKDIRDDDQRAVGIITKMRSLLKDHSMDLESVALAKLVDDVIALVRTEATMNQIDIQVTVANDLPTVRGDAIHLQQVLLNLIINAMDSLRESKQAVREIGVTARTTSQESVEVSVSDNGPGFSVGSLQHLFEAFYTTKEEGLGIGLALSKTIVEAHQGRIWVDAEEMDGATFRFTIPIAESEDP